MPENPSKIIIFAWKYFKASLLTVIRYVSRYFTELGYKVLSANFTSHYIIQKNI